MLWHLRHLHLLVHLVDMRSHLWHSLLVAHAMSLAQVRLAPRKSSHLRLLLLLLLLLLLHVLPQVLFLTLLPCLLLLSSNLFDGKAKLLLLLLRLPLQGLSRRARSSNMRRYSWRKEPTGCRRWRCTLNSFASAAVRGRLGSLT